MTGMITVSHLCKTFFAPTRGEVKAVDDISFQADPGTIYGLIGPNGAGKTTTLRMIASILRPTRGTVTVDGYDVCTHPAEVRRRLGFLSTSTAVYDRMTPGEMVGYFGRLNGMDEATVQARIDELFELLDVNSFRDTLVGNLSTGMKQKVSIARAIVHDPPVVIFDEPTSGLDIMVARNVVDLVASLKDRRRAILLSTHIMSEARRLCDRLGIIHRGQLIAEGTQEQLAEQFGTDDLEDVFFAAVKSTQNTRTESTGPPG
ncbi:MAG: ABC transporter ATP-binding protein [Planctomycetota bacterium]